MGKYAKYSKKYNTDWEKLPCFSGNYSNIVFLFVLSYVIRNIFHIGWLQRVPESYAGEAFCKLCRTALRAHKTDLQKHANTKSHKQRANCLDIQKQTPLSSFGKLN